MSARDDYEELSALADAPATELGSEAETALREIDALRADTSAFLAKLAAIARVVGWGQWP